MKVAIVGGTGAFGRALAKRLAEVGRDDIVVGSRDAERAQSTAEELGVAGGRNQDVVRDVDLVVLAVKSNATLETAKELADAIGRRPSSASRAICASPTRACSPDAIRDRWRRRSHAS